MKELILELKERVKTGGEISYEEALMLAEVTEEVNIDQLREAAHELTIHFHQNKPSLCSLVNAKSYLCGEDCRFCAQSVHYQTLTERYGLIGIDEIAEAGKKAEAAGTRHFCIVTSGAALEEDEFEKVTEARAKALSAQGPVAKGQAENMLTEALKSVFAVAEAYPQLRAVESFTKLQDELADTENKIQAARRFYNGNVRDINTAIQTFPANLVANMFGFTTEAFFQLEEGSVAKEPVAVKF